MSRYCAAWRTSPVHVQRGEKTACRHTHDHNKHSLLQASRALRGAAAQSMAYTGADEACANTYCNMSPQLWKCIRTPNLQAASPKTRARSIQKPQYGPMTRGVAAAERGRSCRTWLGIGLAAGDGGGCRGGAEGLKQKQVSPSDGNCFINKRLYSIVHHLYPVVKWMTDCWRLISR